jgi:hypothetical protein
MSGVPRAFEALKVGGITALRNRGKALWKKRKRKLNWTLKDDILAHVYNPRSLRQESHEFENSLGYIKSPCFKGEKKIEGAQ